MSNLLNVEMLFGHPCCSFCCQRVITWLSHSDHLCICVCVGGSEQELFFLCPVQLFPFTCFDTTLLPPLFLPRYSTNSGTFPHISPEGSHPLYKKDKNLSCDDRFLSFFSLSSLLHPPLTHAQCSHSASSPMLVAELA